MQHYYSVSMIVKKTILPSVHGRLFLPEMTLGTLKNYRIILHIKKYHSYVAMIASISWTRMLFCILTLIYEIFLSGWVNLNLDFATNISKNIVFRWQVEKGSLKQKGIYYFNVEKIDIALHALQYWAFVILRFVIWGRINDAVTQK